MKKQELLNKEHLTPQDIKEYFNYVGLDTVTKKDLDDIIRKHGVQVFDLLMFYEYYQMKCAEKTQMVMFGWTVAVGIATFIAMVATIVGVFINLFQLS